MTRLHDGWMLRWPDGHDALVSALAVAAAYAYLLEALHVFVRGDLAEAGSAAFESLAAEGRTEADLPAVSLVPASSLDAWPSIEEFPAMLIAACEYQRRAGCPTFPDSDPLRDEVWAVAARALEGPGQGGVTVFAESLAGAEEILRPDMVTLVSHSHMVRRHARRLGMRTSPRPPTPAHVPCGKAVVLDARRPDDVGLAAASGALMAFANGDRVGRRALVALGVPTANASQAAVASARLTAGQRSTATSAAATT